MNHGLDRVCVGCFGDESLRRLVRKNLAPGSGTCAHCGRSRVRSAPAGAVAEAVHNFAWGFFQPVEEAWESSSPLSDYLADEEVLSVAVAEAGRADLLVEAILGSGRDDDEEPVDFDRWRRREVPVFPGGVRWYLSDLRRVVGEYGHSLDHVIETRSTFVAGAPSRGRLVDDLPHLEHVVTSGTKLYRARTGGDSGTEAGVFGRVTSPYTGKKIAAPPPHLARGDRVGVAGQRVLFLADSREAAVAEVRPAIGDVVSSAAFVLPVALRIVDLTPPAPPSGTVEASLIQLRRTTLAREIGHEFSQPVGPQRGTALPVHPVRRPAHRRSWLRRDPVSIVAVQRRVQLGTLRSRPGRGAFGVGADPRAGGRVRSRRARPLG